ncbi:MAG: lamin tail domain-containing protein [Patescibacteria group bacterium]|nr:lamin tail domain-containing protein [Patescibacteria group bacterium]
MMQKRLAICLVIASFFVAPIFVSAQTQEDFVLSSLESWMFLQPISDQFSNQNVVRFVDLNGEQQAALFTLRAAINQEYLRFLPGFITTETIKIAVKVAGLLVSIPETTVKELLTELEKQTIEKANEIARDWLFTNEIRTSSGNLVYKKTRAEFQYILSFKKIESGEGKIVVQFSSPESFNPGQSTASSTIGIPFFADELPSDGRVRPSVITVIAEVKSEGRGWAIKSTPRMQVSIEFPDEVPKLELSKDLPYPIEEQRTKLMNYLVSARKVIDALENMGIDTSAIIGKIADTAYNFIYNVSEFISKLTIRGGAGIVLDNNIKIVDVNLEGQFNEIIKEQVELQEIPTQLVLKIENTDVVDIEIVEKKIVEDIKIEEEVKAEEINDVKESDLKIVQCEIPLYEPKLSSIIFNEIAWMGTTNSASDEWIELKNITNQEINLAGWQLMDKARQISVIFKKEHTVSAQTFFILERTDDTSISDVLADIIYTGALSNTNEALYLFDGDCVLRDKVIAESKWPAGLSSVRQTMERRADNTWQTSSGTDGTPKALNSSGYVETQQPPISTSSGSVSTGSGGGGGTPIAVVTYSKILISEVQAEGETVKDEFVELYNPNDSDVDLDGWALKKKTSGGTESNLVSASAFSRTIPANGYFLITPQINEDGSVNFTGAETPDLYYSGKTYSFAKDNTILLYNPNGELVDKVGFGFAEDFENSVTMNSLENQSMNRIWDEINGTYYDRDDNSIDFEVYNSTTPKAKNTSTEPESEPEPELEAQDITSPQVSFSILSETQSTVYFTLSWTGEDPIGETEPSGLDKFYLQYNVTPNADGVFLQYEENDIWQSWQQDQAGELILDATTTSLSLWGQNGVEYNFQIKAKDVAGNESALSTAQTQLSLAKSVVINEIAWMGTDASSSDEWIELYNASEEEVDLSTWSIFGADTGQCINFSEADNYKEGGENPGFIIAASEYLIYANNENTVMERIGGLSVNIADVWDATIGLNNSSPGILRLFNQQDCVDGLIDEVGLSTGAWFVEDNAKKQTMERIEATSSGSDALNWSSNNLITHNGRDADNAYINGTPGQENSLSLAETEIQGLRLTEFDSVTLTLLGSPYSILNPQIIPGGKTLVIEPGVTVNFKSGGGSLRIDGTLTAIGQSEEIITFQSSDSGSWCGMYFTSTSVNSEITFGLIDNASFRASGCSVTGPRYSVWVEDSDITINNTAIQNGDLRYKLHLDNSNSTLNSVTISGANNPSDPDASAILITGGSPTITNSTFSNNHIGIWNKFPSGTPTIQNNTFTNNKYPIKFSSSAGTISGNTASDNTYNGIYIEGAATTDLTWQAGTLPYIVSRFTVQQDKKLTLQAGVVVKFVADPNGKPDFIVQGMLTTQGTSESPVIFTTVSDDSVGGATLGDGGIITNSWRYLQFTSTSTGSVLTDTILKFGGNRNNEGTLHLDNSDITLVNITIQDSLNSAIYSNASTVTGSNLTLTDNTYGFYMQGGICPSIANITITGGEDFHPSSQCNP